MKNAIRLAAAFPIVGAMLAPTAACAQTPEAEATLASLDSVIVKYGVEHKALLVDYVDKVFSKYKKSPYMAVGISKAFFSYDIQTSNDPFVSSQLKPVFHNQDTLNAYRYINIALEIDPTYVPAYIQGGDIPFVYGQHDVALDWYRRAIAANKADPRGYVAYANCATETHTELKDVLADIEMLRELGNYNPGYPYQREMGRLFTKKGYAVRAADSYDQVALDSLSYEDLVNYSFCTFLSDSVPRVQRSYEVVKYALEKNPRSATLNRIAMYDSYKLRLWDETLEHGSRLFNESDNFAPRYRDYTNYAGAYSALGEYDKTIAMYEQALTLDGIDDNTRSMCIGEIVKAYRAGGLYEQAIARQKDFIAKREADGKLTYEDLGGLLSVYLVMADSAAVEQKESIWLEADSVCGVMAEKFPGKNLGQTLYTRFQIAMLIAQQEKYEDVTPRIRFVLPMEKAKVAFDYYSSLGELSYSDKERFKAVSNIIGYYYTIYVNNRFLARIYWQKLLELDPENETAKSVLGIK